MARSQGPDDCDAAGLILIAGLKAKGDAEVCSIVVSVCRDRPLLQSSILHALSQPLSAEEPPKIMEFPENWGEEISDQQLDTIKAMQKWVQDQRDLYLSCASIFNWRHKCLDVPGTIFILLSTIMVAIWPEDIVPLARRIICTLFNMLGLGFTQMDHHLKSKDKAVAFETAALPLEDLSAMLKFKSKWGCRLTYTEATALMTKVETEYRNVIKHAPLVDATLYETAMRIQARADSASRKAHTKTQRSTAVVPSDTKATASHIQVVPSQEQEGALVVAPRQPPPRLA
jgi:hypothetical protein